MNIVLMGVAGCGKTSLGRLLAGQTGGRFFDGDDFHPPANVAKMSRGEPLTDADRAPWLAALAAFLKNSTAEAQAQLSSGSPAPPVLLACSALRRAYRDRLREPAAGDPAVKFLWLHGAPNLLAARLQGRQGHFMGLRMLESQLATLEPPAPGEHIPALDIAPPLPALAAAARRLLAI